MTNPISTKKLKYLVLARLQSETREMAKICHSLYVYVAPFFSRDEWRDRFEDLLDDLQRSGYLESGEISSSGTKDLAKFVRDQTPRGWRMYKRLHFPVLALALESPLGDVIRQFQYGQDRLLACIIARKKNLDLGDVPTRNAVMDALVWEYLGVTTDKPLTVGRIRQLVLAHLVGAECTFTTSNYVELQRLLAARLLGIGEANLRDIQRHLVTEWLRAADDEWPQGGH